MREYTYNNWNRAYYELQSGEDTLDYYHNLYVELEDNPAKKDIEVLKKADKPEDWARYAFETGKQFCVCQLDESEQVIAYFENSDHKMASGSFTVYFLDAKGRVYMHYSFFHTDYMARYNIEIPKDKYGDYFLIQLSFWEYLSDEMEEDEDGDIDDSYSFAWEYNFLPDGSLTVEKTPSYDSYDTSEIEKEVWTVEKPINVSKNWQKKPLFGEWDDIFELKRWNKGELGRVSEFRIPPTKPKTTEMPKSNRRNE